MMSSRVPKTTKSKSPAPVLITIRRNGTQLGPYTIEQVQRMLDDGMVLAADSAAYDGSDRWNRSTRSRV